MKKTTILTVILSFIFLSVSYAQVQTMDEIEKKYQEIDKGVGYKTEMQDPGGYCTMVVQIMKKDNKIAKITLSFASRYASYEKEYYYYNDEVFCVKTKDCSVLQPGEDGVGRSECFKYIHYFNNDGWLYSRYIQGEFKLDGEKSLDCDVGYFQDNEKAFLEYDRATKYLKAAQTNNWSEVCD